MVIITIVAIIVFVVMVSLRDSASEREKGEQEKAERYLSEIEGAKQALLTSSNSASVPILDAGDVGYRPVGKEKLLAVQDGATRVKTNARGRLLVTDKAIVFESRERNERITWNQTADIEILVDGFRIAKRTGPSQIYSVDLPDPKFAATIALLLYRDN